MISEATKPRLLMVTDALGNAQGNAHHEQDDAIVRAYREGGHTQTAIAKAAKLSVSRISRLLAAREAKGKG